MEEIESAIYSLKEAIEEHFGADDGQLAFFAPNNLHDTLKEVKEALDQTNILMDNLVDVMVEIKEVQKQALKWQEMSL